VRPATFNAERPEYIRNQETEFSWRNIKADTKRSFRARSEKNVLQKSDKNSELPYENLPAVPSLNTS
jgi:hypothetical protein